MPEHLEPELIRGPYDTIRHIEDLDLHIRALREVRAHLPHRQDITPRPDALQKSMQYPGTRAIQRLDARAIHDRTRYRRDPVQILPQAGDATRSPSPGQHDLLRRGCGKRDGGGRQVGHG